MPCESGEVAGCHGHMGQMAWPPEPDISGAPQRDLGGREDQPRLPGPLEPPGPTEQRRLLFLDVDGVLHPLQAGPSPRNPVIPGHHLHHTKTRCNIHNQSPAGPGAGADAEGGHVSLLSEDLHAGASSSCVGNRSTDHPQLVLAQAARLKLVATAASSAGSSYCTPWGRSELKRHGYAWGL